MTKEEYINLNNSIKEPLIEKYGSFLYFLSNDIISVSEMEKICELKSFTTERVRIPESYSVYSKLFFEVLNTF